MYVIYNFVTTYAVAIIIAYNLQFCVRLLLSVSDYGSFIKRTNGSLYNSNTLLFWKIMVVLAVYLTVLILFASPVIQTLVATLSILSILFELKKVVAAPILQKGIISTTKLATNR